MAFLVALLAYQFFDEIVVFGTALVGAYIHVRGISVFGGHYPNEVMLFSQLRNGVRPQFDNWFYLYLAGIVLVFVLGTIVQFRYVQTSKHVQENERYHHRHESHYRKHH